MKHVVEKGKTLLVDGPASMLLLSGEIDVLGAVLEVGKKFVIREGKRVPLEVKKKAAFDLMLGEDASFEEIDGQTIPPSWENASKDIFSLGKPVTVMVIGGVDSGKTSFCTYLVNGALKKKWRVAIIDADLGQSDVGPPSTVGFNYITTPVKDLFEIKAENAHFVGLTSPSGAVNSVIEGLTELKNRALKTDLDLLVINTDGWVEDAEASKYKIQLTERVSPSVVVGITQRDDLTSILTSLKEQNTIAIGSPQNVQRRNREKRKILRELSYKKYLKQAKVQSFTLSLVKVEGATLGTGSPLSREHTQTLIDLMGIIPTFSEETVTKLFIVIKKNQLVDEEKIEKVEEKLRKKVKVIREGEEEGLLVGLQDGRRKFLGIGILSGVDYERKAVKVYTPVSEKVTTIRFGQIKLDRNGKEIGLSTVYTDYIL